jgi:16S rRNA (cytosine1402-N4)-methyltransferase
MNVSITNDNYHIPVMLKETINYLEPWRGGNYIDCTLGGGGHSEGILLAMSDQGNLIGIDRDSEAIERASKKLGNFQNFRAVKGSFGDIENIINSLDIKNINGCIFDLGVSSHQLDEAKRGFSFRSESDLDMRMDHDQSLTAYDIVNKSTEQELSKIFWEYGEERKSRKVAYEIVKERQKDPIKTTLQLASIIEKCIPINKNSKHYIHPATRTFMALRIAVNNELLQLSTGLEGILRKINVGGVVVVISYHSLEDRIVKNIFRNLSSDPDIREQYKKDDILSKRLVKRLTKKVLLPTEEEQIKNPRARSAKMRAISVIF